MEGSELQGLLDAARKGDPSAVGALFRAMNPALAAYVGRRAPHVADDLVADTWMAAAEGLASLPDEVDAFEAWLFTVARHKIAQHHRHRGEQLDLVSLELGGEMDRSSVALSGGSSRSSIVPDVADAVVEALSTDEALCRLVRKLPSDQAEVLVLRVIAGLSSDQVAQVMGRSVGWVRVMQHRALRRLRRSWIPERVTP